MHRAVRGAVTFSAVLTLAACSEDRSPLPYRQASKARAAIANYARDTAGLYPAFTRGAKLIRANRDCYASDHARIYCQVSFELFELSAQPGDRWCTTGFTATAAGADARHLRIGDPAGPGWECGTYAANGDPFG